MNIESKLVELEKKLPEMSNAFSIQTVMLARQSKTIGNQCSIIVSQVIEIKELKRLLAQKTVKSTSSNSHLPPSKDLTRSPEKEVKRNQSLREKRQFKSLQNQFAILRSVIDSTIKNGQASFDAIKAIVNMPI